MSELPWVLHAGATAAMAGVLWVVQLAVYPHFAAVGRADFPAYHARYARGISWVVVPLMLAEGATGGWLWWTGLRGPAFTAALLLLPVVWLSTFAVQVPLHARLAGGFDAEAHRRLVATNWVRTAGWSARAALLGWVAAG